MLQPPYEVKEAVEPPPVLSEEGVEEPELAEPEDWDVGGEATLEEALPVVPVPEPVPKPEPVFVPELVFVPEPVFVLKMEP